MNDLAKWTPLLLIGLLALAAWNALKPAPVQPPANFNPWQPNVCPGPYCPAPNHPNVQPQPCPCPRCEKLESSFNAERSAVRRELARTQLNLQQVQSRVNVEKMRMPDWLFYQYPAAYSSGPPTANTGLKWDAPPTASPDGTPPIMSSGPVEDK